MRSAGFDVLTAAEAGNRGQSDAFQLEFATQERRAIYTRNVGDYAALHVTVTRTGQRHGGIVVLTNVELSIGLQVAALIRLDSEAGPEGIAGRIWYLLNYA